MVVIFNIYDKKPKPDGVFLSVEKARNFYINFYECECNSEEEFHKAIDLCKKALKYQEFDNFGKIYYNKRKAKFLF